MWLKDMDDESLQIHLEAWQGTQKEYEEKGDAKSADLSADWVTKIESILETRQQPNKQRVSQQSRGSSMNAMSPQGTINAQIFHRTHRGPCLLPFPATSSAGPGHHRGHWIGPGGPGTAWKAEKARKAVPANERKITVLARAERKN